MTNSPPSPVLSDLLGRWQARPTAPRDALAFGLAPGPEEAFVWQENLPANLAEASAQLTEGESLLAACDQGLADASARLDFFIAETRSAGAEAWPPAAAFAAPTAKQLAGPEAELARWLDIYTGQEAIRFDAGARSQAAHKWQEARLEFQDWAARVQRSLAHYAWVETCVERQLIGRTLVAWGGDFDTVWQAGLVAAQVELHRRNLALAVAHRAALIRVLILVTQSGVKLSGLLASGGGVVAIPMAWQFVNQVLAELQRYRAGEQVTPALAKRNP